MKTLPSISHLLAVPIAVFVVAVSFAYQTSLVWPNKVSFAAMVSDGNGAAHHVFQMSDWLQMFGVDATPVAAEMIQLQSVWNGTNKRNVGQDVCKVSPESWVTSSIPGMVEMHLPDPASAFIHLKISSNVDVRILYRQTFHCTGLTTKSPALVANPFVWRNLNAAKFTSSDRSSWCLTGHAFLRMIQPSQLLYQS